jgi:pimeloyl-ACP methyl ester carboxylesterase
MQFETSNGNSLYYEEFGSPDAAAVMLIHGSTLTGRQDFCVHSNLAERLAQRYRVLVPDCRGHGASEAVRVDGRSTYAFAAMAQDLADLVEGLAAAPAYVIGHSNGGNVALYMVRHHPRAVRAAVLLAANAYIDDHVRTRVPVGMDPERVAREDADWMNEMIALHDDAQGAGYWRELLRATIDETITNPDWTAADLADVRVPCLCVQGENDRVNAPGRHAQVLADWLPGAELWIPPGIGHSVHYERPDEFERRVAMFFDRH